MANFVTIPERAPLGEPTKGDLGTPAGSFGRPTVSENSAGTVKVKGTAGDDRITFADLARDTDHIVHTGDGNDIFNFAIGNSLNPQTRLNAILDMGDGDNDTVILGFDISQYKFTYRSDTSVKIQYVGDGSVDGHAVTFGNAEHFVFRNVVHNENGTFTDFVNKEYDVAELYTALGFPVPGAAVDI